MAKPPWTLWYYCIFLCRCLHPGSRAADCEPSMICENVHQIRDCLAPLRTEGKTLVTTNGCFDILHVGHVRYLAEAGLLGDMLVVGVNSDTCVSRLKGPGRPLQSQRDRCEILDALKSVRGVFVFEEDDPRAFLEILRPDIHVKGGDYPEDIIERPVVEKHGGVVRILSLLPGHSTSDILRKACSSGSV